MIKYSYRNTTLLYPLFFLNSASNPPPNHFDNENIAMNWTFEQELYDYLNMTYRYSINLFRWMKILIITIILIIYLLMHKIISLGIYHCLYLHGTVLSERGTNASCHTICLKDQFQPCRVLTFRKELPHFITWSLYWFSQGACWLKRLSNR